MRLALEIYDLPGLPEIGMGDDLTAIIVAKFGDELHDGDIVAISSKIVSKAEGRAVPASERERAVAAETVRVVAEKTHALGVTRIVENRLGIVGAAAGVDSSNCQPGTVLLLPSDPDATAQAICTALRDKTGLNLGVLITDTLGRPWRAGHTDIAIGAAGFTVLDDMRGRPDAYGRPMEASITAVADEVAAAADLVKGKVSQCPVVVLRGLKKFVLSAQEDARSPHQNAARLIRPASEDMFRLGSAEAYAAGFAEGQSASSASLRTSDGDVGGALI
ncbi:coenzyme F420-0:L-glutamate ligase [Arthrobacter sp. M2012083]|uniref:coenzyme F420-0:L-glutamate ligase n=1 Tax=Arthrobacter sp. M2012083 TaxID=1197706 RepID=UPI0005C8E365|nr:coenzyme F420-0:L-glutamate ligase [Arthrobacter sp. M2012083]